MTPFSLLLLYLLLSLSFEVKSDREIEIYDGGNGTSYPFEVPVYNQGYVIAKHTFGDNEFEAINHIKLCVTWLIPRQGDAPCDFIGDLTNTNEEVTLSVRFGVSYLLPIVTLNHGHAIDDFYVNLTLSIPECERGYGGAGCGSQVMLADYDTPISVSVNETNKNSVYVLFPSSPGYTSATFAANWVLNLDSDVPYEIQTAFCAYDLESYWIKKSKGDSNSSQIVIDAPPSSRSPFVLNPQYWVVEVVVGHDLLLSGFFQWCHDTGKMSDDGKIPCEITIKTLQPLVGVAKSYQIKKEGYFRLFESSSAHLATYNGILALGIDNPPIDVEIGNLAMFYNASLPDSYRSIIVRVVAINETEPVYIWGTNDTQLCPFDCGGPCDNATYLCECDGGTYQSWKCEDDNSFKSREWLLILIGSVAGALVGLAVGVGAVMWRKRDKGRGRATQYDEIDSND